MTKVRIDPLDLHVLMRAAKGESSPMTLRAIQSAGRALDMAAYFPDTRLGRWQRRVGRIEPFVIGYFVGYSVELLLHWWLW